MSPIKLDSRSLGFCFDNQTVSDAQKVGSHKPASKQVWEFVPDISFHFGILNRIKRKIKESTIWHFVLNMQRSEYI